MVDLVAPAGQVVARGFVGHDAVEMPAIIGRSLSELAPELRHPVVHADDLIAVSGTRAPGDVSTGPGRERTDEGVRTWQ